MYNAKIIADSISEESYHYPEVRLTTMEITFPRIVLAEFNTHRVMSRNSASSRAIPVQKRIDAVRADPFIPVSFGKNQKGMTADEHLEMRDAEEAELVWVRALDNALEAASSMQRIGVHKQLANRLLEPFSWHTVIVTATEWENFFNLRCDKNAQPEIRTIAEMMKELYNNSTPELLREGEWHLPYFGKNGGHEDDYYAFSDTDPSALPTSEIPMVSVGRCARVSYLTHDGKRDINADVELTKKLNANGHRSPGEHAAYVCTANDGYLRAHKYPKFVGNFRAPWVQYRKTIHGEDVFKGEQQ